MKRLVCALWVLLIVFSTFAFAETKRTVREQNEYEGKTVETIFSPIDKEYRDGSAKIITYYDGNGKKVKAVIFPTDKSVREEGVAKAIEYYDSDEKLLKGEAFFTDKSAKKNGVAKNIVYFDSNEKEVKMEAYDRKGKLLQTK